jgi:hypothetical protein
MSSFNYQQTTQLLAPIKPQRVLQDGKGHSHVSQQDITAHLIRVFGFGSFDTDILDVECVFEQERAHPNTGVGTNRWDVCYRALLRLTIRDESGNEVCHYVDGSTATAQNQARGDAHDLAYKSALSLAKKRAAINLGDQFGLSLYNKGQMTALVGGTYIWPAKPEEPAEHEDVQDGVEQQVSLGNDEIDREQNQDEPDPVIVARIAVASAWQETRGELDRDAVEETFAMWSQGEVFGDAAADRLDRFAKWLTDYPLANATAVSE